MRRTILIIPALVGALGAAPAFAQSDDVLGDEDYPADDYAAPAEEYAGDDDYGSSTYDDGDSYADVDADYDYGDTGTYDGAYAGRTVAPETFHRELAPYGRWVRTPEYGLVWIPSRSIVGADFVPYATGGSWRYSNVGWTFATNWSWGWAPFHYGRWYRAPRWGWVWVPGSVWGPAWVDWRYGDGYIGWAPLPPRRHAGWLRRHDYWFFCSARDMWRPNIWRYRVRSTPRLFQVAVVTRRPVRHGGRTRWFAGPNPRHVERVIGRRVDRVQLRPNRHERILRRADRRQRVDRSQRVERQQRIERPVRRQFERPQRQQRIERRQQQRVERQFRPERQHQVREQRQQMREQRQHQVREQRQHQVREQRQHQMREQRQHQRAERQSARRVERQQAREQRQQQRRERRQRPDR